jgi:NADH:ubiquinone oxidoreductase subunit 6 (subunit J)
MKDVSNSTRLAQSASALGAAMLGFGLGAEWGNVIENYAIAIITVGAIFHVWGMYLMQMKDRNEKQNSVAKALWISAWICLLALIAAILYLMVNK